MAVQIRVVQGDALTYRADVLVLKYAQRSYGVDAKVVQLLARAGHDARPHLPQPGDSWMIDSLAVVGTAEILFIGVVPQGVFGYAAVRDFAARALSTLALDRPDTKTIATTLQGVGFGLDAAESFRAQVAGYLDAVDDGRAPGELSTIDVVVLDDRVAQRFQTMLDSDILPGQPVGVAHEKPAALKDARAALSLVGQASEQKRHVFVAMPFGGGDFDDRYHYAIESSANKAGYLCERIDQVSFTGEIMTKIRDRIDSAALVIADLTGANPNVYLEIGYAWGKGVPTVLILQSGEKPKFDVDAQRRLIFGSIKNLEDLLTRELAGLS